MKSAIQWSRLAACVLVMAGLAAVGTVFPGCAPAPEEPAVSPPPEIVQPPADQTAPAPAEEAAQPPVEEKAEPPAEEKAKPPAEEKATPPAEEKPAPPAEEKAAPPAGEKAAPPAEEKAAPPVEGKAAPKGGAAAAAVDPSKVSTFAPAEDLVAQVDEYIEDLEEVVESEEEYNEWKEKLARDSNTVVIIALALGLHDTDHKLKAAASGMMEASQQVAAAADYASAQAGVAAVKAALASTEGDSSALKWEKVASLPELMKKVPLIYNSRLKRYLRRSRFEECAGYSAVLAVIAQGSLDNSGDTEKPDEVEKWHAFCVQMRDAAAAVNAACHAEDKDACDAAMEVLQKSCDDCHEVFHPGVDTAGTPAEPD